MNLDDQLHQALKREAAPPDFAAQVIARAKADKRVQPMPRRVLTLALIAALLLAMVGPAAIANRQRRERQQAAQAREQLVAALNITQMQIRRVSAKLQRNSKGPL